MKPEFVNMARVYPSFTDQQIVADQTRVIVSIYRMVGQPWKKSPIKYSVINGFVTWEGDGFK